MRRTNNVGVFGVCSLLVVLVAGAAMAGNLDRKYNAETIADGLDAVRRYVGKKDFESHMNGGVVVVRLDETISQNYSSQQSEVATFLQKACTFETGARYRDDDGRVQLNIGRAEGPYAPGASHIIHVRSATGVQYQQELRPIIEALVDEVSADSKFKLKRRPYDPRSSLGYSKYDYVYNCVGLQSEAKNDDWGYALKLIVSNKFYDTASSRYLSVIITGDALQQGIQSAREDASGADAFLAAQAQKEQQKKADQERLDGENLKREAEISAFRNGLAIGDSTQCGYVIGIRHPMVEVAGDENSRWLPIEKLVPKGTPYVSCPVSDSELDRIASAKQMCEAQKDSCLANCYAQMRTVDISAPSAGQLLCRDSCTKVKCE